MKQEKTVARDPKKLNRNNTSRMNTKQNNTQPEKFKCENFILERIRQSIRIATISSIFC